MTYPTAAVTTTNCDAGSDSPATARTDILDALTTLNQMIAHTTAFAATLLDDANAATARATLGAAASGANTDITSITGNAATATDSSKLGGALPAAYQAALGYSPVQQGTGVGQSGNLVKVGWGGSGLKVTVDSTDYGYTWPISISGNAANGGVAKDAYGSVGEYRTLSSAGVPSLGTYYAGSSLVGSPSGTWRCESENVWFDTRTYYTALYQRIA